MGCLYPFSSTAFKISSFNFKSLKVAVLSFGAEAFSSSTGMMSDVELMPSLGGWCVLLSQTSAASVFTSTGCSCASLKNKNKKMHVYL